MIIPAKHWNCSVYQLSKQCFIGMMITANHWNRLFAWAPSLGIGFGIDIGTFESAILLVILQDEI